MQKKPEVKYKSATGLVRFLRAASLALPLLTLPAVESGAAAWQWSSHGQRERITIPLDVTPGTFPNASKGGISVTRTGGQSLLLRMPGAQAVTAGNAPASGQLVSGLAPTREGLELTLATPAFGYLVNKSDPKKLVIDIFHDPLGARWTATGELAPAAVAEAFRQPPAPLRAEAQTAGQAPVALAPATPANLSQGKPASAPAAQTVPTVGSVHTDADDDHLPVLDASASLRPEMAESTPPALVVAEKALPQPKGADLLSGLTLATTAVAADNGLPARAPVLTAGERGTSPNPQELFGRVNNGGPENWPSNEGLSTTLSPSLPAGSATRGTAGTPGAPAPSAATAPETQTALRQSVTPPAQPSPPVSGQKALAQESAPAAAPQSPMAPTASVTPERADSTEEAQGNVVSLRQVPVAAPVGNATIATNSTRPVIYMDEAGNVVPKPPEPDKMLAEAERLLESTQFKEALALLQEIKAISSITPQMREKVLYLISDATESLYADDPLKAFEPVTSTTSEALNANLRSTRVPDALFRLGMAHLRVNNFSEAEGYFKALKRRFPQDMNVPPAFVNLGKVQLEKGLPADAAANFRQVLQEYPESNVLRDAAVGLVRALVQLGENAEAVLIADFVDKRWTRHYLNDLSFLEVLARLNLRLGKLDEALQQYWLLYNLDPAREGNASVLATIGDIYWRTDRPKAATEIFSEIRRRYPDTDAARMALLRLAEKGIHDGPVTIEEMFKVFDNPGNPAPQVAYRQLRSEDPTAPRSVLAGLKLAMWDLWSKQYTDAMGAAADFIDQHPEHADVEQAREVIMRAFMADLKNSLAEENYGRVLILWNGFPLVRQRYGAIDPALRNALGRGYLERGDDAKALELFAEFLKTPKDPKYGDATFALYFNKYLQAGDWNALLDLGDTVKDWEMSPAMRGQLNYALALSAQNLDLSPKALPLWQKIAADTTAPLYQRAYAYHFLAKDAELRSDIHDAYTYNKEALGLFSKLEQERSDKADPERMKEAIGALMDITEVANRIPEALEWVERYNDYAPEGSLEFPGLRFREARLYRKLGDNAKAKSLYELIVQKAPDSPFAKAAETELRTFNVSRDLRDLLPPPAAPQ